MKRFRLVDLPLIVKMGFAPAFALLMLAVLATGSVMVQHKQSAALEEVVNQDMRENLRIQALSQRIESVHGELYLALTHAAGNIDVAQVGDKMTHAIAELKAVKTELVAIEKTMPPAERADIDNLIKALDECSSAIDVVSGMVGADFQTAVGFVAPFEDQYVKMTALLDKVVERANKATETRVAQRRAEAQAAQTISIFGSIATVLIVGGLAIVSVLKTRQAINDIAGATGALAKGDNNQDLDKLARKDELGAIVGSLAVFKENQINLQRMRAEQDSARAMTDQERQARAAADAEVRAKAEQMVAELGRGLEHLAKGDLTFRVAAAFPDEYAKLKEDFNGAMSQLQETMKVISSSTEGLRTGADEIAHASDDLSRRTEQQAASLEETAAALDELTATVRRTASGARQASEVVATARGEAQHSGDVVNQAVSAMGEIESSSRQIGNIIGVIDEIAFQTNLLALNAGVEAARAGEAGRGFAVVASEVRALAQRSAEAAKEIKTLISSSSKQVGAGVNLVGQTGEALQRIVTKVGEIDALVTEIAASAAEQATGLQEVNTAVNQMDQVTQQNAAMVEQSTAATHSLKGETGELVRLMSRFQVGSHAAASRPMAASPATHAPARNPVAEQRARIDAFASRPAVSGNTALAAAPAEDGWEEF